MKFIFRTKKTCSLLHTNKTCTKAWDKFHFPLWQSFCPLERKVILRGNMLCNFIPLCWKKPECCEGDMWGNAILRISSICQHNNQSFTYSAIGAFSGRSFDLDNNSVKRNAIPTLQKRLRYEKWVIYPRKPSAEIESHARGDSKPRLFSKHPWKLPLKRKEESGWHPHPSIPGLWVLKDQKVVRSGNNRKTLQFLEQKWGFWTDRRTPHYFFP